jgi:hypothetical protein
VLALLRAELEHAMALGGRPDVACVDRGLVVPADRPLPHGLLREGSGGTPGS